MVLRGQNVLPASTLIKGAWNCNRALSTLTDLLNPLMWAEPAVSRAGGGCSVEHFPSPGADLLWCGALLCRHSRTHVIRKQSRPCAAWLSECAHLGQSSLSRRGVPCPVQCSWRVRSGVLPLGGSFLPPDILGEQLKIYRAQKSLLDKNHIVSVEIILCLTKIMIFL